jgi:hypothetical protein
MFREIMVAVSFIMIADCATPADSTNRSMVIVTVPSIRFIAEQDGQFEQTVKSGIAKVLQLHPEIQQAYLVSIAYEDSTTGVALGIVSEQEATSGVLSGVQAAFAEVAPSNLSINIIFLSTEEQKQVAAIARPFYVYP